MAGGVSAMATTAAVPLARSLPCPADSKIFEIENGHATDMEVPLLPMDNTLSGEHKKIIPILQIELCTF